MPREEEGNLLAFIHVFPLSFPLSPCVSVSVSISLSVSHCLCLSHTPLHV